MITSCERPTAAEGGPDPLRKGRGGRPSRLVFRNTGIYTLGNVLPQAVNVLLLPVFTRFLSRSDYGILNYTTALSAFLFVVGTLSIHSYLLRHSFECRDEEEKARLFGSVFLFLLAFNLLLLGLMMLVLPPVFDRLKSQVPFHPYVEYALFVNGVEALLTVPMAYFRVRQEAGRFVMVTVSRTLIATGLSFYFVVGLEWGVLGRYYGLLAEAALALGGCLSVMPRIARLVWDGSEVSAGLRFSWPLLPGALFLNITAVSDRLILERFVPLAELGIYALGATLASSLAFLTTGVYRAIEPEIYRMSGEPGFADRILAVKRGLVLAALAAAFLLIGFSRELVAVLVAEEFRECRYVLAILVLPIALQGISIPASCYLLSVHRTRRLPAIALAGALASVAGNLVLVPLLGIYGAAATAVAAGTVTLFMYQAGTGIRWRFERDAALLVLAAAAGFGLSRIETPVPAMTIGLKAAGAAACLSLISVTGLRARRTVETPAT